MLKNTRPTIQACMKYEEYLKSPRWTKIKELYSRSLMPQCCVSCGNVRYELHHRSYKRLWNERWGDLIPLCRKCHYAVHQWLRANGYNVWDTHVALRKINSWGKCKTRRIIKLFAAKNKTWKFNRK